MITSPNCNRQLLIHAGISLDSGGLQERLNQFYVEQENILKIYCYPTWCKTSLYNHGFFMQNQDLCSHIPGTGSRTTSVPHIGRCFEPGCFLWNKMLFHQVDNSRALVQSALATKRTKYWVGWGFEKVVKGLKCLLQHFY